MKRKSVLILSPFFRPNVGGVETHLDDLVNYLRKHNVYVYVLTYQPLTTRAKGKSIEKSRNLEIRRLQWFGYNLFHKLEKYPILEFVYLFPGLFVFVLYFMIRNHSEISTIHAHGFISAFIARIIKFFYPKTLVMSTHAIYDFKRRGFMAYLAKWILDGFDYIMPLAGASELDLLNAGISKRKIRYYSQWVNQDLFKPRNKLFCRRKVGLSSKKESFIILFVGRLIEKKGVLLLASVAREFPAFDFVFVGDGPVLNKLRKVAKTSRNIHPVGKKTQSETALFYGAADVVVIPSLYEEGFARVVLEALSSGRPVIASKKGCLPEMINNKVGMLISPTKIEVKKAIRFFATNEDILYKFSRRAREYAIRKFSERNADAILACYNLE